MKRWFEDFICWAFIYLLLFTCGKHLVLAISPIIVKGLILLAFIIAPVFAGILSLFFKLLSIDSTFMLIMFAGAVKGLEMMFFVAVPLLAGVFIILFFFVKYLPFRYSDIDWSTGTIKLFGMYDFCTYRYYCAELDDAIKQLEKRISKVNNSKSRNLLITIRDIWVQILQSSTIGNYKYGLLNDVAEMYMFPFITIVDDYVGIQENADFGVAVLEETIEKGKVIFENLSKTRTDKKLQKIDKKAYSFLQVAEKNGVLCNEPNTALFKA